MTIEKDKLIFDPLGDGISCLEYIDHMGNDMSICRAARVSYQKDNQEPNLIKDEKLIKYMLQNHHSSPFEHTAITLHAALPLFVARQWIRHRIGVSYNELSRRYTSDNIQFYFPKEWRYQDKKNKQSSLSGFGFDNETYDQYLRFICNEANRRYEIMIENGIGNEMARMILPVNLYTRWYFTCNVQSAMHFHRLRADEHAQYEIQVYANALSEIMLQLFPITWKAYLEIEKGN